MKLKVPDIGKFILLRKISDEMDILGIGMGRAASRLGPSWAEPNKLFGPFWLGSKASWFHLARARPEPNFWSSYWLEARAELLMSQNLAVICQYFNEKVV